MAFGSTAQADAGKFQFVYDDVTLTRADGSSFRPNKGDSLEEGDLLTTGPKAQAQIRMNDSGILALRPNSRMRIEVFRFSGKADGTEQSVLSLLRGGFRAITGLVGSLNKDKYKITTPSASIGIRGTDHEVFYIAPAAQGEVPIGPPGTYNKVNVGQTYIETLAGRLNLASNQVGYAALTDNTAPVRLPSTPDFLKSTPALQPVASKAGQSSPQDSSGAAATPEEDAIIASNFAPPPPIAPMISGVFNPANSVNAPNGTALVGGTSSASGLSTGAGVIGATGDNIALIRDSAGDALIVSADNFNYSRNAAPALMSGTARVGGEVVRWGIYDGGTLIDNGVEGSHTKFFWMDSTSASTAANLSTALSTGPITFSSVGGFTTPIAEGGDVGGRVTSSTVTIVGSSSVPSISVYSVGVTDALGRTWIGRLIGGPYALTAFQTSGSMNLSVSCAGGACGTNTGSGNVQGVSIGNPIPVGLLSSYKLHGAGSTSVIGSVLTR